MPRQGSTEIIAGRNIANRFKRSDVNETIRFAMRNRTVVGVFDAGNKGFSSEIWRDVE